MQTWTVTFNGSACNRQYRSADGRFIIERMFSGFVLIDTSRTTERVLCSGAQLGTCKLIAAQRLHSSICAS